MLNSDAMPHGARAEVEKALSMALTVLARKSGLQLLELLLALGAHPAAQVTMQKSSGERADGPLVLVVLVQLREALENLTRGIVSQYQTYAT